MYMIFILTFPSNSLCSLNIKLNFLEAASSAKAYLYKELLISLHDISTGNSTSQRLEVIESTSIQGVVAGVPESKDCRLITLTLAIYSRYITNHIDSAVSGLYILYLCLYIQSIFCPLTNCKAIIYNKLHSAVTINSSASQGQAYRLPLRMSTYFYYYIIIQYGLPTFSVRFSSNTYAYNAFSDRVCLIFKRSYRREMQYYC